MQEVVSASYMERNRCTYTNPNNIPEKENYPNQCCHLIASLAFEWHSPNPPPGSMGEEEEMIDRF